MLNEGNLRKSKRQPVPNRMYSQGINELKKESNIKHKKKGKNQDDDLPSYSESKNEIYDYIPQVATHIEEKDSFIKCILPGGAEMNVQFVVQFRGKEEEKKKQVKPIPVQAPAPKPQKKENLLSLFKQAIQDADEKGDNSEGQVSAKQSPVLENPKPQPIARPQRVRNEDEGMIQKVNIEGGVMKLDHSVLGSVDIPVEWEVKERMKEEIDGEMVELKKKLEECKFLKNLPILSL